MEMEPAVGSAIICVFGWASVLCWIVLAAAVVFERSH
jgi:hypothetical protein